MGALESRPYAGGSRRQAWWVILIPNRISLPAPTIMFWPRKAWWPRRFRVTDCTADYHQPSDDVAHIDFKHMDAAIGSLLRPVSWLVNSSFTPQVERGRKTLRAVVGRQSSVVSQVTSKHTMLLTTEDRD